MIILFDTLKVPINCLLAFPKNGNRFEAYNKLKTHQEIFGQWREKMSIVAWKGVLCLRNARNSFTGMIFFVCGDFRHNRAWFLILVLYYNLFRFQFPLLDYQSLKHALDFKSPSITHAAIAKLGHEKDPSLVSSLISTYASCGYVNIAWRVTHATFLLWIYMIFAFIEMRCWSFSVGNTSPKQHERRIQNYLYICKAFLG